KGSAFENRVRTRIDGAVDFDWGLGAADAALPKDEFSIRWSGVLKASVGGRYELLVYANAGARIWINDKIILEEANLARKRTGARVLLELPAGLHGVRIEYWDGGGAAKMRLFWQRPGTKEEEVVPGGCWYHDAYLVGG
ncbi:MAG: PA14 domain-containing protein, partial [Planctomycetota bacterium]|nr:PA14 domain-containing protein [Planctomycetota bacterium]